MEAKIESDQVFYGTWEELLEAADNEECPEFFGYSWSKDQLENQDWEFQIGELYENCWVAIDAEFSNNLSSVKLKSKTEEEAWNEKLPLDWWVGGDPLPNEAILVKSEGDKHLFFHDEDE